MELDHQFTATVEKSPNKGGWSYVVMPGSASTSAPEDWSRRGPYRRPPLRELLHGARDGRHKLPIKAGLRHAIGSGDTATVVLEERLERDR